MSNGQEGMVALRAREEGRMSSSIYALTPFPLSSYQSAVGVVWGTAAAALVPLRYLYICIETHLCICMNI